jgi:hypothetical protein
LHDGNWVCAQLGGLLVHEAHLSSVIQIFVE